MDIEGRVLRQPSQPVGEYTVPMEVKGVIRYVTPHQWYYDHLALIGFFGGLAIMAIVVKFLERSNSK